MLLLNKLLKILSLLLISKKEVSFVKMSDGVVKVCNLAWQHQVNIKLRVKIVIKLCFINVLDLKSQISHRYL